MEISGKIKSIYMDFLNQKPNIVIEMDDDIVEEAFDFLVNKELRISFEEYKKSRSVNANAFYWKLVDALAAGLSAEGFAYKNSDVHMCLLRDYGRFTIETIPKNEEELIPMYFKYYEILGSVLIDNEEFIQVRVFQESHTLNTRDFSRLIKGAIQELGSIGLQPPPEKDASKSLEKWRVSPNGNL